MSKKLLLAATSKGPKNELYAWGSNMTAMYGNGYVSQYYPSSPVQISSDIALPATPMTLSSGGHALRLGANGAIYVVGQNTSGALGLNIPEVEIKSSPVQLGTLTTWRKIGIGDATSFGIQSDGTLWSWGDNTFGVLGDGTTVNKSSPVQVGTLTNWSFVSGSTYTTVAIKTDGTLWAWGNNSNGQLGDNTVANKSSPVQVGTQTNWAEAYAGLDNWVIARKTDGTLWVWGINFYGQLGDGTTIDKSSPVQVGTQTNWASAKAATQVAIALKTDGTLWGWGRNQRGNVGTGDTTAYSSPVQIGTLTNWKAIAVNGTSSYAVKTDGTLWAWGYNNNGQLGDGTIVQKNSPIQVGTLRIWGAINTSTTASNLIAATTSGQLFMSGYNNSYIFGDGTTVNKSSPVLVGAQGYWGAFSIRANETAMAVKVDNSLWGWGRNSGGVLGNSNTIDKSSPIQVAAGTGQWNSADAGFFTLAIGVDGSLWSWGFNSNGALGSGTTTSRSSPVQVGALTDWRKVQGSTNYVSVALKKDNTMWAWGNNSSGSFGNGSTIRRSSPVQIGGSTSDWSDFSLQNGTVLAIKTNGQLWAWGENSFGVLGTGTTITRSAAIQIGTLTDWAAVSVGQSSSAAIKSDGSIWTWGRNNDGQLGDGTTISRSSPVQVGTLTDWASITSCAGFMIATKPDGTMWAWGNNSGGQYGNWDNVNRSSPVQVNSGKTWGAPLSGNNAVLAVDSTNKLYGWGFNYYGELAQNSIFFGNYSSPTQIGTNGNWASVSSADSSAYGIKRDGTMWAWGSGSGGRLGINGTNGVSSPTQIGTLTTWSKVSSGTANAGALRSDGTIWMWGSGSYGAIGDGTTNDKSSPTQVGLRTDWTNIAVAGQFSLGIRSPGTLYAWGRNTNGTLGDNTTLSRSSPVQIGTLNTWQTIAAGGQSNGFVSMAIKTDGTLWAWGFNGAAGAVGDGTTINRSSPVQIGTLNTWSKIATTGLASYAIKTDGTLWAWGLNENGQLGLGNTVNRNSPVQVGTLTTWSNVWAVTESQNVTALKTDGTLWAWGYDGYFGSLGQNIIQTSRSSPVQVGTLTGWQQAYVNSKVTTYPDEGSLGIV